MNENPAQVGATIAEQVRAYRIKRGWSVRQLADECAKHGAPQLTTSSLGNIERGQDPTAKRKPREVSVDELLVLAYVLNVKPAELMFKSGGPMIEVAPGIVVRPYVAWGWLYGIVPMSDIWGPLIKDEKEITYPNAWFGWHYFDQAYYMVVGARQMLKDAKTAGADVTQPPDDSGGSSRLDMYQQALIRVGIALSQVDSVDLPIDIPPIPRWLHDDLRDAEAAGMLRMQDGSGGHPRADENGWIPVRLPRDIAIEEES